MDWMDHVRELAGGLDVGDDTLRIMRFREIIVEGTRALPRKEYEWLFADLINSAQTTEEKARATGRLTNLTIRSAQVLRDMMRECRVERVQGFQDTQQPA
jgi:hypothetical protein